MKNIKSLLLMLVSISQLSFQQRASNNNMVTLLTIQGYNRSNTGRPLVQTQPTDSIFTYRGMALEKLTGLYQIEFNEQRKLTAEASGYNLINLLNKKYITLDTLEKVITSSPSLWRSLSSKKIGAPIDFPIYHSEKTIEKDTIYHNSKCKKVRYANQSGQIVSVILGEELTPNDIHFYDLERKYHRRIRFLSFKEKNGSEDVVIIDSTTIKVSKHPEALILAKIAKQ